VDTDENGYNDAVYVTALCQVLQLQTGESPIYADYGIPSQQSITTQVFPDMAVYLTQQRYANYFAFLKIAKVNELNQYNVPTPVYNVTVIAQSGSVINRQVPVPQ
jgi:hypothetical protein